MVGKTKAQVNLTVGPLLPRIIVYTVPIILSGILQLLFNTADTLVVGRYGGATVDECETALAAVGSCGALTALLTNLFLGLSVGSGVCVAHDIGAEKWDKVDKVVHTSVLTSIICGIGVSVFGFIAARPALALMGTEASVLDEAVPYMRAVFCGMPACMIYNFCATMLRSRGDTVHPMIFLTVAGVLNVALNLVMVIVFGLGALGVGIATAVSQYVSCFAVLIFMMRLDGPCRVSLKELQIDKESLRRIVVIGLPAGLQGCIFSISNVLIQSSVNSFGKVVVAGNTAASNLDGYIYIAQNALYHTVLTFVGQNRGAHKYDRAVRSIGWCSLLVTAVGLFFGFGEFAFGRQLLTLFAPDNPAVVEAGMARLQVICTTYFLCGLMEVGCGALRGMGKSLTPMIISLTGSCVMRIVWIYTVFRIHPTQFILYVSYPISWLLTAGTHFIFCAVILNHRLHGIPGRRTTITTNSVNSVNAVNAVDADNTADTTDSQ